MCGSPTDKPLYLCLLKVDDIHQPNNELATEADNCRFKLWLD
jgi:hypothetical protein